MNNATFIGTGWLISSILIAPLFDRNGLWYTIFIFLPLIILTVGLIQLYRAHSRRTYI